MSESNLMETFGSRLFDDRVMREMLPENIYSAIRKIRDEGTPWQPEVADVAAEAMKTWAMNLGATHYIHWFSPMTGAGAGKHEGFIDGVREGQPILSFSGKMLSKSEADASSFPSGGLRSTFEARGYTTWDPTSPAFVLGTTLYIPTAFCSYTSDALDQKTPLLRSMQALNKQAVRVLRAMGDEETRSVIATVGAEQEYFLVDKNMYDRRLDLKVCGRTLIGAKPPKGQELEDHYYGAISERVRAFMRELDFELWRLGVPAKTEHNEAAPGQYELANVYATANIACDHNQLTMELMQKVAARHGLACLLHEKPFAGINGSGKHDNWGLSTNTGKNLLSPSGAPQDDVQFLLFLSSVYAAVDDYADLLRLSASCPGNDYRLGGSEAPPPIISVFLGNVLHRTLHCIAHDKASDVSEAGPLLTGVDTLPLFKLDDNDRNRTSPFAFTGNKFEFRMVGSSQSIGLAGAVLNAAVADVLSRFADTLEAAKDKRAAALELIADTYRTHKRIIFNGNNYSAEWRAEAEARGLCGAASTVEAIPAFLRQKNIALFTRTGVFTPEECHSRYEIMLEHYRKTVRIEINTMIEIVARQILPAAYAYLKTLSETANAAKAAGCLPKSLGEKLACLSGAIDNASDNLTALQDALASVSGSFDPDELITAQSYHSITQNEMARLRLSVDTLEGLMSDEAWPIPNYNEMLFAL